MSPAQTLLQKAKFALAVNRPKNAVPLLLQALGVASGGEKAMILWQLARAFEKQGDLKAALEWNERAAAFAPADASVFWLRGTLLEKLNRVKEAEDAAREAVRLDPEMAAAHYLLYEIYQKTNQADKALVYAKRYRELSPHDPSGYYALANLALESAKKARKEGRDAFLLEAETLLRDGLVLDPGDGYLFRLVGRLREVQNRPADALFAYMEAARLMPESEYERNNVRRGMHTLLIGNGTPLNKTTPNKRRYATCLVCVFIQGTAFVWHAGAWAAFALAFSFAFAAEGFATFFPHYTLRGHAAFRQAAPQTKKMLHQAALSLRNSWRKGGANLAIPLVMALIINMPPLLLRGLWNAGVWFFHVCVAPAK